jgi:hypothetical protein
MAENENRGMRGWLRRGSAKTEPASRPNSPGTATGPGAASGIRPAVDDPTRSAAFGDPWSADAWSDEGWDDGWNDRTRRASVRPAAEPRSADVDAWLESDQTQFADVTADMARKWKANVPAAVGSTWEDDAPETQVPTTVESDPSPLPSDELTIAARELVDEEVASTDLAADLATEAEPNTDQPADEPRSSSESLLDAASDAGSDSIDEPATEQGLAGVSADRVATPLGSVVPVVSSSGISWGASAQATSNEAVSRIASPSVQPYEETDEEARIDALLAEAENNTDDDELSEPLPTAHELPEPLRTAESVSHDHHSDESIAQAAAVSESEEFESFDDDVDTPAESAEGAGAESQIDCANADPEVLHTVSEADSDADLPVESRTEPFKPADADGPSAELSVGPDPADIDTDIKDEHVAPPATILPETIESASVASDEPIVPDRLDEPLPPAVTAIPRPGSTWDDDEIEQQIDHILAEPSLDTALDEHVDDAFVADIDRSIERDLVAEFGSDDDDAFSPLSPAVAPSAADLRPPISADLRPPAALVSAPASMQAPAAAAPPPAANPASVMADVQATAKPQPAMIPAATGHLVSLFLVSGLGLAVAAVLRLSVIAAGAAREERGLPGNAFSLSDRLGKAASGLGTLHGLLLLSAIVCAVLAAAAGRGRSKRDERLAGWICGAALAAGLAGIAAAGLGIKFVTDNGSSFSGVAGDLADLIGLAVTSLAAVWGSWRASDPNP